MLDKAVGTQGSGGGIKSICHELTLWKICSLLILTHIVSFAHQHIYMTRSVNKSMAMDSNATLLGLHLLLIYVILTCYFYLVLGSIQFHVSH